MTKKRLTVKPSRRLTVYAGIDAGGSHSEVVIVDTGDRELGRVRGGPAALRPDNSATVARTLAGIVRKASNQSKIGTIKGLVVAAAGAGRPAERKMLEKALSTYKLATKVKVIGDGEAALESVFPAEPGIIVISGTGSIAYARDREGTIHRVGGLGWQLGDEGSGYALGRAALSVASKAAEGRGPATSLIEAIYRATSVDNLDDLVRWSQRAGRADVAALAQLVGEAAIMGDQTARQLLNQAATELGGHVEALLRKLAPTDRDGVALGGGLLQAGSPLRVQLSATLKQVAPAIQILNRTIDPALGAASLATRL